MLVYFGFDYTYEQERKTNMWIQMATRLNISHSKIDNYVLLIRKNSCHEFVSNVVTGS